MLGLVAIPAPAQETLAQQPPVPGPMSAIDWLEAGNGLSDLPGGVSVASPPYPLFHNPDEPAVATSITVPEVTTSALDAPKVGAVGLLPRSVTGLPADLWQASQGQRLARLLGNLDVAPSPAMQSLLYTLLLAEAEPPHDDPDGSAFLVARIDLLTRLGAVDPALALADRADPGTDKTLFSRWFDLALLAGEENRACQRMADMPTMAPSVTALSFCRARLGDWETAALTFASASALGTLPKPEERLLRLYLDPDLADGTPALPPPARMTPLAFRLAESIGQPVPTTGLPRAYAVSDLRGLAGWKAEIEAAERLARSGALAENRLLGIYTARAPAASGGIWDRVDLIQRLDAALAAEDEDALSEVLPPAWAAIRAARLELPFARLWGARLARLDLDARAARAAFEMALLSPEYETLARGLTATTPRETFLLSLAAGAPADPPDARASAIAQGFAPDADVPGTLRLKLRQKQLGEAMLAAMELFLSGAGGETKDIAPALTTLRAVGLEDLARRAALQLMILERRI